MKIDLSTIDLENFHVLERSVSNETVYLVFPRPGVVWDQNNLVYRSSVWTKDGELISASFKKFFNWDEQPNINPKPVSLSGCRLIEKIDGSTLIISKFKNNLIIRTRGSIDVSGCENSNEIEIFKTLYPKVFEIEEGSSYIFEWVSPTNRIVLKYEKPELYLTANIDHLDYSMLSQEKLDDLAIELEVNRPKIFKFSSLEDMFASVKEFKGIEGICVYYNHDQNIRKVKSIKYLTLHRFKFDLSLENVLEMFLRFERPKYNEFLSKIAQEFDWECIEFVQSYVSKICDATIEVNKILDSMRAFANSVKSFSRKEAAEKIISAYGKTSRSSYVFNFFDGREINNEGLKKLYLQVLC
jgi:hypothetical protein